MPPLTQHAQQPEWVLDAVKDAEAVDEVEALLEPVERERVHPPVLDRPSRAIEDGAEAATATTTGTPWRSGFAACFRMGAGHLVDREALGGLLIGTASPLTGAPGAALLYVLAGLIAWPRAAC